MHNLSLIGMPGSGKSTVGVLLAKALARDFVDTDLLIQRRAKRTLQAILDQDGIPALRQIEAEVLSGLDCTYSIIATGGSAVYSTPAMDHLKTLGPIVFLDVGLDELARRLTNFATRGIAMRPGQDFAGLFAERHPLYRRFADITIDATHLTQAEAVEAIRHAL